VRVPTFVPRVHCMFDLQIDKKKKQKNKTFSSMNKSCEKKQQHIVKIFYMWMNFLHRQNRFY
jgi:hypothetical protein